VKIQLNPDWTEFLSLLISKRVRFVLVGAHEVVAHGGPRLTEVLDVFVEPTLANATRACSSSSTRPATPTHPPQPQRGTKQSEGTANRTAGRWAEIAVATSVNQSQGSAAAATVGR
jgi:hypothetical protein